MKANWRVQRERGGRMTLRLIRGIGLTLGRRLTISLLWPISLYFCLFAPTARRSSSAFLSRALGRRPNLFQIWRHFFTFAVSLLDRLYLVTSRREGLHIEIEGQEALFGARDSGAGCVLIGSHLGNFDAVRACGLSLGAPLKILMQIEQSPAMMSALYGPHPAWQESVISLGKPDTFLRVNEALENGAFVAMLGDRASRQEKSIPLPFLGSTALFPAGPMLLAALTCRPVVLFFGLYLGKGHYLVRFEPLVGRGEFDGCGRDTAVKAMLSRYAARLEAQCRRTPYNWYNFYDFWHDA